MGTKLMFEVTYANPEITKVNKFLRACDIWVEQEGLSITEVYQVEMKDGVICTKKRIDNVQENIWKAFKTAGCDVFSVKFLTKIKQ